MTASTSPHQHSECPISHGPPPDTSEPRVALYMPEFADDPHRAYREMRARGPVSAVDIAPGTPAMLITNYRQALKILADEGYPTDPSAWQQRAPLDCPALPTLRWRPDALRNAGDQHTRLRRAVSAALERVDQFQLRAVVECATVELINSFCQTGETDLLYEFAIPLVARVLNWLLGLPPQPAGDAFAAMMMVRQAADPAMVEQGNTDLTAAMARAVKAKRTAPGADVATWLLEHPGLDDAEVAYQLAMLYSFGSQPTWNLIANTVRLMVTDDRIGGDILGGALSPRDVIDEVLFSDPPLASSSPRFPPQMKIIANTVLPAHQPVLVSLAACNTDPALVGGDRTGNRSHLAWGAGSHACPAQSLASVIVTEALGLLLDALSDIELAESAETDPRWLPNPFHRAQRALPVRFSPSPPLR